MMGSMPEGASMGRLLQVFRVAMALAVFTIAVLLATISLQTSRFG